MKELLKKQKNRKNIRATGFTLVETLVGLLIFTVAVVALMSVLGSGISTTTYAKQKLAAQFLAQEGIECVRNRRDTEVLSSPSGGQAGWTAFTTLIAPPNAICTTISGVTGFTREIWSQSTSFPNEIQVFSKITSQGARPYTVTFSEHLFNWIE